MKPISIIRIDELINYATNYGEVSETWPNGRRNSDGNEMNDLWRDSIVALKQLRELRTVNAGEA